MLAHVRRDVPGFVWVIGFVGLLGLVVGYGLDLDSKWGDGLRELGWLGIGVLITVAGVDIAQRRARADRWGRLVRADARRLIARLGAELWEELLLSTDMLDLFVWTPSPTRSLDSCLTEAFEAVGAARKWLWAVQSELRKPGFDPTDLEWRELASGSPLFAPGEPDALRETANRAVAALDQLVEVTDDPTLGREVIELRHDVERVLEYRASEPVPRESLVLVEPNAEQRAAVDALAATTWATEMLIDRLRTIVQRFPADDES